MEYINGERKWKGFWLRYFSQSKTGQQDRYVVHKSYFGFVQRQGLAFNVFINQWQKLSSCCTVQITTTNHEYYIDLLSFIHQVYEINFKIETKTYNRVTTAKKNTTSTNKKYIYRNNIATQFFKGHIIGMYAVVRSHANNSII